jgi:hypothetical protein
MAMRIARLTLAMAAASLATGTMAGPSPVAAARALPIDQSMPAIAFNPHPDVNSFLLVWTEDRGAGSDVYAKRLFVNGLPQGGAARAGWAVIRDSEPAGRAPAPRGQRADPSIVYDGARQQYMLVYSELVDEQVGWDVFCVRVSTAGYAVGRPRRLATGTGDQRRPDVAAIGDDRNATDDYLVVWEDNTRDVDEVWGQRLQPNGIPRGAPYALVRGSSNASDPTTNGTAVAWLDDRNGQADIYSIRLRNGLPNGPETALVSDMLEEFNPRYSSGGLIWNVYDPLTGVDIMGVEVIENNRTRGGGSVILVPAADQAWPDMDNGVIVFGDNRSGEYDLYAVRVVTGGRIRALGHDYPVVTDQ